VKRSALRCKEAVAVVFSAMSRKNTALVQDDDVSDGEFCPVLTDAWEILVCVAGACRRAGAEAVFCEIEELTKGMRCSVKKSGCLGECSLAPNAVAVRKDQEIMLTRLDSIEKSIDGVIQITGNTIDTNDPDLRKRLMTARQLRVRKQARDEKKWNTAMRGMAGEISVKASAEEKVPIQLELAQLYGCAGMWQSALAIFMQVEATIGLHPQILIQRGLALGKLCYLEDLKDLIAVVGRMKLKQQALILAELNSALMNATSILHKKIFKECDFVTLSGMSTSVLEGATGVVLGPIDAATDRYPIEILSPHVCFAPAIMEQLSFVSE